MVQVFGSLTPMWETWMNFLILGFSMAPVDIWGISQQIDLSVSFSLSLCLSNYKCKFFFSFFFFFKKEVSGQQN